MKINSLFDAVRAFFVYDGDVTSNSTGVDRYLSKNNIVSQPQAKTSVDLYLQGLVSEPSVEKFADVVVQEDKSEALNVEVGVTSVSEPVLLKPIKSIKDSFFGAIRAFFVYEDDAIKTSSTGVARYLQENIMPDPVATGVAQYLEQSEATELEVATKLTEEGHTETIKEITTSVAKYMQKQTELANELPVFSGVEMYLQDLDIATEKPIVTKVGAYLEQDNLQNEATAIFAKYQTQDDAKEDTLKATGVTDYIAENILNTAIKIGKTSVTDYMDRENKTKEAEAIIARYLEHKQVMAEADATKSTGVVQYLATQTKKENDKPDKPSGVAAYIEKSATEVEVTAIIERHLESEQAQVTKEQKTLNLSANRKSVVKIRHRISSVDQYVKKLNAKATQASLKSGVDRFLLDQDLDASQQQADAIINSYLDRQSQLLEEQSLSGVAKYICNLAETDKATISSVDRYLVNWSALTGVNAIRKNISGVTAYLENQDLAKNIPN